jgi:hypothetical protein
MRVRRGASGRAGILGGQHLLHCGSGSERNDTHHSIRDTMFYIMQEARYSVRREQSGVMPIREGEAGGRVMDLVAVLRFSGWLPGAGGHRGGGSDMVYGGHGDGGGARARGTAGGGDQLRLGSTAITSQMRPSFRLQ